MERKKINLSRGLARLASLDSRLRLDRCGGSRVGKESPALARYHPDLVIVQASLTPALYVTDMLNNAIIQMVNLIMKNFTAEDPPDPAYLFTLPNQIVHAAPNLLAFQKIGVGSGISGGGKWGFDIYFEKEEGGGEKWDCE